ncbi:MAG: NuoM family protein [Vulcanibacillus sp.]
MESIGLLSLITFSPLLGVILLAFVPSNRVGTVKLIGILVTLIPLILALVLFSGFNPNIDGMQFLEDVSWIEIPLGDGTASGGTILEFKYSMGVDGLSLALILLATIVVSMSAIAAANMIKKRWKEYYILFSLLQVGLFGVFLCQNLFLFFVFFEITLITMFFLIGIWGLEQREKAAYTFLIYNGLGSAIMLVAFIALTINAGATYSNNMTIFTSDISTIIYNLTNSNSPYYVIEQITGEPAFSDTFKYGVFFALLVAFGIKLPLFPFHSWILKVHYQAPPPMSMILSGVLLKIGAYGLFRIEYSFFPDITSSLSLLIIILGIINLFYGGILAFVQKDFKMVIVYSSISHMGIIMLGLGSMNTFGFQGAIFQMVSHGLLSALFFYIVGIIYNRAHTAKLAELGGLAKTMPFTSGILLAGALASLGLPGMSGFISEFMTFLGLFQNHPILAAISTVGIIITTAYLLRATLKITFGETVDILKDVKEIRSIEVIPLFVLLGFIILIGVYPAILSEPLQMTIKSLLTVIGG